MGLRGDHLVTLIIQSAKKTARVKTAIKNSAIAWPVKDNAIEMSVRLSQLTRGAIPTTVVRFLTWILVPVWNCAPVWKSEPTWNHASKWKFVPKNLLFLLIFTSIHYSLAHPQSPEPLFHTHFDTPLDESDWAGDLTMFRIDPSFDDGMLRLDAPRETGMAWIATREKYKAVYWEWSIRQAFAPSNNNRAFIFLNSSEPSLDGGVTGKAIRTGENGNPKHFRLLSFKDGHPSPDLLKSDLLIESNTEYRIRLVVSPDREMHLYMAEGGKSTPLLQSEYVSIPDDFEDGYGHFGFRTHFTATRSDQFFFGDAAIWDVLPVPKITGFQIEAEPHLEKSTGRWLQSSITGTTMELTFNVPPDVSYLDISLFTLDDGTQPDRINCAHVQICTLYFDDALAAGERNLTVNGYQTIYGQQTGPETLDFLVADIPEPEDVIINEFMYRPPQPVPTYVEQIGRAHV